jgi:catechol 2,3-dioxygenase
MDEDRVRMLLEYIQSIRYNITMNMEDDPFLINSSMKINHVHLKVSNLQESIDFYKSILGFKVLKEDVPGNTAFLIPDPYYVDIKGTLDSQSPLLALTQIRHDNSDYKYLNKLERQAGLYHFALLLPEREYLAAFLRHLKENLDQQYYEGMADHAVSESIYIHDPDRIGIEIYRDRPPSEWKWDNNKVHMVTEPLDANNLLTRCNTKTWNALPIGTTIGHVHLHVSNLINAKNFYNGVLGLYHTATYPGAYFFAANGYHHHIATNTWIGTNILPANSDQQDGPGLDHYAISLPINNNNKDMTKLRHEFANHGIVIDDNIPDIDRQYHDNTFYIYDHDGLKIQLIFC